MWWLPDLRITAAISMAAACWIAGQAYKRSAARRVSVDLASAPGVDYYRASLERERDVYQALPVWFVPPVVLSTTAIVVGFLTTTRFPHGPALFGFLAWFACGTGRRSCFRDSEQPPRGEAISGADRCPEPAGGAHPVRKGRLHRTREH
jgi:hypothetical protein